MDWQSQTQGFSPIIFGPQALHGICAIDTAVTSGFNLHLELRPQVQNGALICRNPHFDCVIGLPQRQRQPRPQHPASKADTSGIQPPSRIVVEVMTAFPFLGSDCRVSFWITSAQCMKSSSPRTWPFRPSSKCVVMLKDRCAAVMFCPKVPQILTPQ